jgi:hypothetical protein
MSDRPEFAAVFLSPEAIGAALAGLYSMEHLGLVPRGSQGALKEAKPPGKGKER